MFVRQNPKESSCVRNGIAYGQEMGQGSPHYLKWPQKRMKTEEFQISSVEINITRMI